MKTQTMNDTQLRYGNFQVSVLVILRMMIGWHFLYEGVIKALNPSWSAGGFLMDSKWIFADMFHSMATNPATLDIINTLNIWGLIAIGLGLITGLFSRAAAIGGIVLLSLYYLSHPPLIGLKYALPAEGSYLIVNKNLIEIFALAVLFAFPTSRIIGLDRLIFKAPVDEEEIRVEKEMQNV
ncbi:DoxX family membrane protein [Chondrinema litorale]|uniref:DoxX family membrane protein n=1 Tax=Chondrinema litorale TaxID=2994555 RepID=UPI00254298C2|nr:DoxX family membrane protein [Chondrinema litorale]UZR94936.1 DoxX family membrane protein [Chondrinema litorale]